MGEETLKHISGSIPNIRLKKSMRTTYSWDISTSGETFKEVLEEIKETNEALIDEYGTKKEKGETEE